jgi:hypothetical protein
MKHHYGRNLAFTLVVVCLLVIAPFSAWALDSSKSEELQRKIADITLLKQQLADRKLHAESMREGLLNQHEELVAEIRLLQKSYGFKSYQQAKALDRARYNMELLQSIIAYNQIFAEKIKLYQTGHDKLNYLLQLAQDDIKMIRTLHDFEIDALTTQISLVINRYIGEAHVIQIDPRRIKLTSPKNIWNRVVKGKY